MKIVLASGQQEYLKKKIHLHKIQAEKRLVMRSLLMKIHYVRNSPRTKTLLRIVLPSRRLHTGRVVEMAFQREPRYIRSILQDPTAKAGNVPNLAVQSVAKYSLTLLLIGRYAIFINLLDIHLG